jgi:hypothetical protein
MRIQNPSQLLGRGGILRVHKHSSQNQISSYESIYIYMCVCVHMAVVLNFLKAVK